MNSTGSYGCRCQAPLSPHQYNLTSLSNIITINKLGVFTPGILSCSATRRCTTCYIIFATTYRNMPHDATKKVCSHWMCCIVLHNPTHCNASCVKSEHANERLAWPWTMSAQHRSPVVFDPDRHVCEGACMRSLTLLAHNCCRPSKWQMGECSSRGIN